MGAPHVRWPGPALLVLAALAGTPTVVRCQEVGTVAPDFLAPLVSDSTAGWWQLWSRPAAPLTVVNFWATWCKPCEKLHPLMLQVAHTYASRGVRVVTINMREPADSIRRLLAADSGSVTLDLLDPDGQITELYTVTSVPTTLLIAENNVVLRRWEGVKAVQSSLEPVMERLLAAEPASGGRRLGCSD